MPKRKPSRPKSFKDTLPDLDETVDPNDEEYMYDDVDKFHRKREKLALGNYGNESEESSDAEEEVLQVGGEESDDEEEYDDDNHDSDDEDEEDDDDSDEDDDEKMEDKDHIPGVPSSKAWGKKRSMYYGTDKLDGLQGFDRDEALDREAEEALKMRNRMLDEIDVSLFKFKKPTTSSAKDATESKSALKTGKLNAEKYEVDISTLSVEEQWKLVYEQWPEVEYLRKNYPVYNIQREKLQKLLPLVKMRRLSEQWMRWIINRHKTLVLYLMHVNHYFSIIRLGKSLENHEIKDKLTDLAVRVSEGDSRYEQLKKQIDWALKPEQQHLFIPKNDEEKEALERKINLKTFFDKKPVKKEAVKPAKKARVAATQRKTETLEDTLQAQRVGEDSGSEEVDEDENRRGVNRQIAKNTGYKTTKARKLDRNPRVKHREKFRRANIRRKGQVKPYKTEDKKYSGEHSGIREGVIRSVKLK